MIFQSGKRRFPPLAVGSGIIAGSFFALELVCDLRGSLLSRDGTGLDEFICPATCSAGKGANS